MNEISEYGWSSSASSHSSAYLTPKVLEVLASLNAQRTVDLGSGNGALCRALHDAGYDVVGVERDPGGVDIAAGTSPEIPFYHMDVTGDPESLLSKEAPFDVAVSTEVIEHLYSPHLFLDYASAVVKPGGHLVISTPYHGYLKNLALAVAGKWDHHHTALWHGGHIKFWSRQTLSALLEQEGFDVLEFHGAGRFPGFWKSMILVARKREEEASKGA